MTAIEKETLQDGLCCGCDCKDFNAKLTYKLDVTNKKAKVTDASEFDTGDDLKTVIVHVYDSEGNEKHDHIDSAGGDVEIDVADLVLNNVSITATAISEQGCKADFGIYNLGSAALSGEVGNKANQGNRNVN